MSDGRQDRPLPEGWRARAHEIIYEAETPAGKAFDVALIVTILLSILVVMLESVPSIAERYGGVLRLAEWAFTVLFTVEYVLRLLCVGVPASYARSFFGVVDLLAVLPTYVSLFIPGAQALIVIRALRILRVFRVLKLVHYVSETEDLVRAMRASARKILVFLFAVVTLAVILGSLMYLVEGPEHDFTSIPKGIYWAIVTLTTVGYGDLTPQTTGGQMVASLIMILGYGIIAVPTGIVTVEMGLARRSHVSTEACRDCSAEGHDVDATYCKFCGAKL
jgi:voltage-gated potassium channel